MPPEMKVYDGADDSALPSDVKGFEPEVRLRWIETYTSAFAACTDRDDGESDCEAEAVEVANAALVKLPEKGSDADLAKDDDELPTTDLTNVEILRVGKWNGIDFTQADLESMVEAFSALRGVYDPPAKLGHKEKGQELLKADGMPAVGWVSKLSLKGDRLIADFAKVPATFAKLVKSGAYRKRSAEVWFGANFGGKKYAAVLKAVAWLGAEPPAVSSLSDVVGLYTAEPTEVGSLVVLSLDEAPLAGDEVRLSKSEGGHPDVTINEQELRQILGITEGADLSAAVRDLKTKADTSIDPSAVEETQRKVVELSAEITSMRAERAIDGAIQEGKLLPRQRDWAVAYFTKDAEGFKAFIESTPKVVEFGATGSTGDGGPSGQTEPAELSAVEKQVAQLLQVDPERLAKAR